MLSEEAIKEFQEIYFREFGKRLSIKEATEQASDLLRIYRSVTSEIMDDCGNEKKG